MPYKAGKTGYDVLLKCPCGRTPQRIINGYVTLRFSKSGGVCRKCVHDKLGFSLRWTPEAFAAKVLEVQGAGVRYEGYQAGNQKLRAWCDGCVCGKGKLILARAMLQPGLCKTKARIRPNFVLRYPPVQILSFTLLQIRLQHF